MYIITQMFLRWKMLAYSKYPKTQKIFKNLLLTRFNRRKCWNMLSLRRCFWYRVSFSIEKPSVISENSNYLFHLLMYIYHEQMKKEKYHQQKAYDLMIKQLASHRCRLKTTKSHELNIGRLSSSSRRSFL